MTNIQILWSFVAILAACTVPAYWLVYHLNRRGRVIVELLSYKQQLEHRLVKRSAELAAITAERDQVVQEARITEFKLQQSQKMEAVGTLTGGMAHDFNNLLGVIIGNLDLADELLDAAHPVKGLIAEALAASTSGGKLTHSLLSFSRKQKLPISHINLNHTVRTMNMLLSRVLGEQNKIVLELAADLWLVMSDLPRIETSIMNLAINARDAMPDGGTLRIRTANHTAGVDEPEPVALTIPAAPAPGDYVMVSVSDTGTGMSQDVIKRIFEPFFSTKEPGRGTGLGLSMILNFVIHSAGFVTVASQPGQGSQIGFFLPREASDAQSNLPGAAATLVGHNQTILIVEDNNALRLIVERQLARLGYKTLQADSARAALAVLETETVDLIFCDVVMPGGTNGVQLADQVRERWPQVKILLTSGFLNEVIDSRSNVLKPLIKPYNINNLSHALRAALGS